MKQFLISYQFAGSSEEEWHAQVKEFIAQLESHPAVAGRVAYQCLKSAKSNQYYHIATVADDEAVKALGELDFFKAYTHRTEEVAEGEVTVTPLLQVAASKPLA